MSNAKDEIFYWSVPAHNWAVWDRANREHHKRAEISLVVPEPVRPSLPHKIITKPRRYSRTAGIYHMKKPKQ